MINYQALQLAFRAELNQILVATATGTMSIVNKTISRSSGSFLEDGFRPGMEITGANLAAPENEEPAVIREVLDGALTVDRSLTTESSGPNKTIRALLPSGRAYENDDYAPVAGYPYLEEQFLPGPNTQLTAGPNGRMEGLPLYVMTVNVPLNVGIGARNAYAQAILDHFRPRYAFDLSDGSRAQVRTAPAPFMGQGQRVTDGYMSLAVTIPLRLFTINP